MTGDHGAWADANNSLPHPDVARCLSNLAEIYRYQERYAEAAALHKQALAISEKALGPGHPDIAYSLNDLALTYRDQGSYKEAEPLLIRALSIRENALGFDHQSTRATREALDALRLQS